MKRQIHCRLSQNQWQQLPDMNASENKEVSLLMLWRRNKLKLLIIMVSLQFGKILNMKLSRSAFSFTFPITASVFVYLKSDRSFSKHVSLNILSTTVILTVVGHFCCSSLSPNHVCDASFAIETKTFQNFSTHGKCLLAKGNFSAVGFRFSEKKLLFQYVLTFLIGQCSIWSSWRKFPWILGKALKRK